MEKKWQVIAVMAVLMSICWAHANDSVSLLSAEGSTKRELVTIITNGNGEHLLADSIGKTLYTFDSDIGQKTSTCAGDCAEIWPPILITADEALKIKSPLGTIVRANKKKQLTHNGKPVYLYAFDRVAGDEFGDGIGGVWHRIKIE